MNTLCLNLVVVAGVAAVIGGLTYLWKEADNFWAVFNKSRTLVELAKTEQDLLDLDVEIVNWASKAVWHRIHADAVIGLRRQISAMRRGILLGKGQK